MLPSTRIVLVVVACTSFALLGIVNLFTGDTNAGIASILLAIANALLLL